MMAKTTAQYEWEKTAELLGHLDETAGFSIWMRLRARREVPTTSIVLTNSFKKLPNWLVEFTVRELSQGFRTRDEAQDPRQHVVVRFPKEHHNDFRALVLAMRSSQTRLSIDKRLTLLDATERPGSDTNVQVFIDLTTSEGGGGHPYIVVVDIVEFLKLTREQRSQELRRYDTCAYFDPDGTCTIAPKDDGVDASVWLKRLYGVSRYQEYIELFELLDAPEEEDRTIANILQAIAADDDNDLRRDLLRNVELVAAAIDHLNARKSTRHGTVESIINAAMTASAKELSIYQCDILSFFHENDLIDDTTHHATIARMTKPAVWMVFPRVERPGKSLLDALRVSAICTVVGTSDTQGRSPIPMSQYSTADEKVRYDLACWSCAVMADVWAVPVADMLRDLPYGSSLSAHEVWKMIEVGRAMPHFQRWLSNRRDNFVSYRGAHRHTNKPVATVRNLLAQNVTPKEEAMNPTKALGR